jgi:hypothetical protein
MRLDAAKHLDGLTEIVGARAHDLERVVQIEVGTRVARVAEEPVPLLQRLGLLAVRRKQGAETSKIPLRKLVRTDAFAGRKIFPVRRAAGTDASLHEFLDAFESGMDRSAGVGQFTEGRHSGPIGPSV